MHIKKDDTVEVIIGDDRGVRARVIRVHRQDGKVLVEGVNLVYKHVRRSQKNPQGGRLSKEMPIAIANVRLVCSKCNKATRTGARFDEEGAKSRYCKKCGSGLGPLAPPHRGHAKTTK